MPEEPQSGAEVLARIRPTRREESTFLCLRPDLLDAWEDANNRLAELQTEDAAGARLGTGVSAATKAAAKRVKELEDEIEATQIKFTLRAMSKDQWRVLCDANPPRKENQMDQYVGYDRDAVLDAAVRECLVDPVFDDASWAAFLDVCNPSEWAELRSTATSVNRSVTDAPKSALASRILDKPANASKQRARGK